MKFGCDWPNNFRGENLRKWLTDDNGLTSGRVNYTISEPRSEKTGLRGFRPGPIQTGLCSQRRWLEP